MAFRPCDSCVAPCRPGPVVGIEDHFYNYMIYQLAFGLVAPVIDGGVAKIQVRGPCCSLWERSEDPGERPLLLIMWA
eukprot:1161263-Pelagomonas_calceolata.AAC.4